MEDGETVLLIDSGKDQHAIDLHMKVERYVSDEIGVPETDRAFIKE